MPRTRRTTPAHTTKPGSASRCSPTWTAACSTSAHQTPGRTHDHAAFTRTGLDQLLADTPTLGDLGYPGTSVLRPRRKRPGHHDHDPATNVWNRSIATPRIAVERTIAHLKNWKNLATGYRGRLTELPNIIRIITTLEYHQLR